MKATETKSTTAPSKKNSPFFSKDGDHNFFGSNYKERPFFNKSTNNVSSIQPKLTIGQPDDKYEHEADTMADKVVQRLNDNNATIENKKINGIQTKPLTTANTLTPFVQTKCDSCEQEEKLQKKDKEDDSDLLNGKLQKKPIFESNAEPPDEKNIQRKCTDCEKEEQKNLQTKSEDSSSSHASQSIESDLSSSKGSGNPLPEDTKTQMESSFGADFSNVRIHNDSSAVKMNEDLNAQAFTQGNDVYFNSGKYDTNSSDGKNLLAHELTHTIQQGGSIKKKSQSVSSNTIQKAPLAVQEPVSSGIVDISSNKFMPSEKVKGEITQAGNKGLDVRVIVPGISEAGKIKIKLDSQGNFDAVNGQKGYMPVTNPWAKQIGGLYLRFTVKNNMVMGGFVSTSQTGGNPNDFIKKIKNNSDILGGVGLKVGKIPELTNEFNGNTFKLGVTDMGIEVGGFVDAKFNLLLENNAKPKIDAVADVNVKGVAKGQLKLDNTKEKLTGEVSLAVEYKDFAGNVIVKYNEDGSIDIHGKAAYNANKLSGEIDFVSTDLQSANNFAKDAIKAAGGKDNVQNATPPATAPAPKEGKKERALAAVGQLQFNLAEWFAGTVNVIVDGKGDITVIGKIAPPAEIELFKQKDFDKELVSLQIEAGYGIPFIGTIGLFAGVSLSAVAYIGPAKFYNIEIQGTYSTDPEVQKNIEISGSINVSAYAGLRLAAEGGAKLTLLAHDLKFGVGVNADVGVKAYVDARPTIGYRDPGEFFISGTLEMVAQPMLGLSGNLFIELDAPWWSPIGDDKWVWPIGSKEWPLTDPIGLSATMKEYVLGSGTAPEIEFKEPEFDPSKFMTKMVDKQLPEKSGAGKESQGSFKEDGSIADPEVADPKADKTGKGKGADLKDGKGASALKDDGKKTPPDPKAQQEAALLFKDGAAKLENVAGPISKADLGKKLYSIEKSVAGIKYQIKLEGNDWIVTASAKGINAKPLKIAAIVTDEDKEAEGKRDSIDAALGEIDQEGKQKIADGEVTTEDASQIASDVKRDHPLIVESISVIDGGETWDFVYVQKKSGKKSLPKKPRPILNMDTKLSYDTGSAIAKPLTNKKGGSEDTIDIPGWDHAKKLNMAKAPDKQGRGGDWVTGHKISYRFGGEGSNAKNLFIIDRSANGQMAGAEGEAAGVLAELVSLKKEDDPDYNKVMFYEIQYSLHASSGILSAFGKNINLTWGTINVNGSGKNVKGTKSASSEKPPEKADEVRYNVNNTGWETFLDVTKDDGIISTFSQNLMRIRISYGKYDSIEDITTKLKLYHNTNISDETVSNQIKILNGILNDNLEFIVK